MPRRQPAALESYFGPKAHIMGIDIDPRCRDYEEEQIGILIGDQADTDLLDMVGVSSMWL